VFVITLTYSPPREEGWLRVNQKSRSHLIPRRRGGRSHDTFQTAFRSGTCERPPRPLH